MKNIRNELYGTYKTMRRCKKLPCLTRPEFEAAMGEESREATAEDGTIDGSDLRKAFLAVAGRESGKARRT